MSHRVHICARESAFRRDERGATALEFALVAPLLCFALLSLVEIGVLGMMASGLDNAVAEVARKIRTGQGSAPTDVGSFEDQVCANLGGNVSGCRARLVVSAQTFSKFVDAGASVTSPPNGDFDKGGAGDIVIVKADYNWPLITPFMATGYPHAGPMSVTLGTRLAFKNEPFK
ncbi:TadE/TadG family type IV pilus assembly protein [uncultured Phenylobacterium sp.]|uniref:TadE/TadG family type IV pilus assembly protein n=1 Tax=uncultured Phenylobacterium sp. TaxID=349273 RepID=UPI0025E3B784|nr:TadE/TadG family type IV pilus assembly protein [uncultured Phenylobacterium sp.]